MIPNGGPVSIQLHWTLAYKYFPLADSVLQFSQVCDQKCTLGPIPPVDYSMTLSRDGTADISDWFHLGVWEQKIYELPKIQKFTTEKIGNISSDDTLGNSLIGNAQIHIDQNISYLGTLKSGKIFGMRSLEKSTDIGIVTLDTFNSLMSFPFPIFSGKLDASKEFFILQKSKNEQDILSIHLSESMNFPFSEPIKMVDHTDLWKVTTDRSVYTFDGNTWTKNPRFSDFIDLDQTHRIGYIRASDVDKKSLGNYKQNGGIFVLLDRTDGSSQVVAENKDIIGFFSFGWFPVYLDTSSGDVYKVSITQ